jgi:NTP pyrophosphatase (non-canonical NTP hydrolase)
MDRSSDLSSLTERAMEVRELFAALERARAGKPWTREEIMQGFIGDVGDLMKLVMAKGGLREIPNHEEKLAHELSDCLWSILVLAELYGVDLQQAFHSTMDQLQESITRKLATESQEEG